MDRIAGGIWGMLVGDALGVPYEFKRPKDLPPAGQLEMTPPEGYRKTYEDVPEGTWSDDGAQALCLLESLLVRDELDLRDFAGRVLQWLRQGLWTPDGIVFDVGNQTYAALSEFEQGVPPEQCGLVHPEGKGNGALMRTLPLALWHGGSDRELVMDAHRQSLPTHGHVCNQVCCAWYCLLARRLLEGCAFPEAYRLSLGGMREIYRGMPEYAAELELLEPDKPMKGTGTGYVADCLKSAFMVLSEAQDYEDAVRRAISLGYDTDTTACVTGGLAGVEYGAESIPQRWLETMRGRDAVDQLLQKLKAWRR